MDFSQVTSMNGIMTRAWTIYIRRHMNKLMPVVDSVLPTSSTINSLLPLSLPELTDRVCGSAPNESVVDSRTLAQIRKWLPAQHKKIMELARKLNQIRNGSRVYLGLEAPAGQHCCAHSMVSMQRPMRRASLQGMVMWCGSRQRRVLSL